MPDLMIREEDGWEELQDVEGAATSGALDVDALWAAVGQGNAEEAADMVMDAGWAFDESEKVVGVRMVAVPDDMLGRLRRIWVKTEKK